MNEAVTKNKLFAKASYVQRDGIETGMNFLCGERQQLFGVGPFYADIGSIFRICTHA